MMERRTVMARIGLWALGPALAAPAAQAATHLRASVHVPGPGNLLFLPITLATRIGADQAEGLDIDIRYVGGGPQAFRAMLERNSDFSAGGFSALALQKLAGKPVACIVPLTRVPAYTLLVRRDLRGQIRQMGDLKGRVVGVKGHVPGGRSTSQLFAEYLLAQAGITPTQVNYVSAGQSYDSQHAALASGTVDAIVADEPFVTRLIRGNVAYALADFHELEATRRLLGGLFLNGMLATRQDVITERPVLVEKMVRTLKRTLVWMATHSAEDIVDALAPADPQERQALLDVLRVRKNIYSADGLVSDEQLATVDRFLRATEPAFLAQGLSVRDLVDSRWAGRMP